MVWVTTPLVLIACALVAGCGDDESPSSANSPPPDQSGEELRGRTFISTAVTKDGESRPLVAGTRIRVIFEARNDVRWHAGCNDFGADVEIIAGSLLVGQIGGTEVGCPDDLHQQDEWIADFFDSDPEWRVHDQELTLTSDRTVIELDAEGS